MPSKGLVNSRSMLKFNFMLLKILVMISKSKLYILIKGTASDVLGMESDTWLRNTVSERRTVTSEIIKMKRHFPIKLFVHYLKQKFAKVNI